MHKADNLPTGPGNPLVYSIIYASVRLRNQLVRRSAELPDDIQCAVGRTAVLNNMFDVLVALGLYTSQSITFSESRLKS